MVDFQPGQQVRLTGTFRNLITNELEDPTTVTLKVQDATGTQTVYTYAAAEIVRDSKGVYHRDITITKPNKGGGGNWYYRYEGTGNVVTANETSFPVGQSQF